MSNLIQSQQKAPQLHLKEISIIPISVPSKAGKSTKTDPAVTNLQLLEDYGKKRCTDRYDSSESSDSGVVTLSCTDSNTTSSDTSDPGSPYSPTSASDDAAQNSMMKGSPTNLKNLKRQSTSSDKLNVGKRAKKDDKNNNSNAADIRVPQLPTKPSLVTLSSASNKVAQIMPVISLVSTTQPPNLATLSSASNKMTGYYKQKKDLNSILTPNNISDPIIKKHFEQYCQIISSSAGSQNGKLNGPPATTVATAITNISKQIKKLEKKTPKVAPVLPVARKIASNLHPQLKISPKKPVSIAPRIIEPKRILPQKQAALVSPQKGGKMSSPQQTVLLTAIRIPSNQFQQQQGQISQPPPLKMQNGLMHKSTTSTTTTTTKIAPYMASVQYHQQPMLPNLIHLPNILAAQHNMQAKTTVSSSNTSSTQNIYVNNSMSTQQQQSHQLYSMNGAILKFQPIVTSQAQQTQSNGATHVSYTQAAQQQKLNQIAHQMAQINTQQLAQQLFMTTPVMFNGLPVLSSQLASLQQVFNQQQAQMVPPTTIPALQPIQNNSLLTTLANLQAAASSGNSTTTSNTQSNSIQLPSINTLLHHHNQNQQFHLSSNHFGQALTNIPLSTQQLLKYSSPQAYNSLPPSLTITSNFMQQQRSIANSNTSTYVTNAMPTLSSPKLAPLTQNTIPITFASMPKLVPVSQQPILHIPKAPVTPKPSPIKMPALTKSLLEPVREKQILVVAPLPSPAKKIAEIHVKVEIVQKTQTPIPEIVVKKEEIKNELEISIEVDEKVPSLEIEPCAKSPMLQQPKTIRFPATHGTNGKGKRFIKIVSGMCSWEKCGKKFDNNSILLEHVQQNHVSQQAGPFMCSWDDCKVNGRESCSRKWIERHVLCHVGRGAKPFKCIVDKCGIYFGSQISLEKHVNGHFTTQDQQNGKDRRSADLPAPKKIKPGFRKTRSRRQNAWSARRFDFFDSGIMEGLQYKLKFTEHIARGVNSIVTFRGRVCMKRTTGRGDEYLIKWEPSNIIDDEWIKKPENPCTALKKEVSVKNMTPRQKTVMHEYVQEISSRKFGITPTRKPRKQGSTTSNSCYSSSASFMASTSSSMASCSASSSESCRSGTSNTSV